MIEFSSLFRRGVRSHGHAPTHVQTCDKSQAQVKLDYMFLLHNCSCLIMIMQPYYMRLKRFFLSIFFRFSLILSLYKKILSFYLVVFVWFAWLLSRMLKSLATLSSLISLLLSKQKNSFFKIYIANIRFEFRSSHQRCSIKKAVLRYFAVFTGKHLCWSLFLIKRDSNTGVFMLIQQNF